MIKTNGLPLAITLVLLAAAVAYLFLGDSHPVYRGRDGEDRDRALWKNMRDVQVAAERYAANHGGNRYPSEIDDAFKSFLPGGGNDGRRPRPVGLINAFSGANEWPALGSLKSAADISRLKAQDPPWLAPGRIEYSPVDNGRGYAVIGGAHTGKALVDYDGKPLVLTNFSAEELAELSEK